MDPQDKEKEFNVDYLSDDEVQQKQNFPSAPDEDEDEKYNKSNLENAIPIDKMKNGMSTASAYFKWGFSSLKQKAVEANTELQKNEQVQHLTSKIQPALNNLNEGFNEKVKPRLKEGMQKLGENAQTVYEKSLPTVEKAYQQAEKTFEEIKKTVAETGKPKGGSGPDSK